MGVKVTWQRTWLGRNTAVGQGSRRDTTNDGNSLGCGGLAAKQRAQRGSD